MFPQIVFSKDFTGIYASWKLEHPIHTFSPVTLM